MRKVLLLSSAVAVLLLGVGRIQAADECHAIIDKAIKAMGGEEKLKKQQFWQVKNKGKIHIMGGFDITQEVSVSVAGKLKETVNLEVNGQNVTITTVYNGEKGWINVNGQVMDLQDKLLEEVKEAMYLLKNMRLTELKSGKVELSPLGEGKVEDKATVGIRVASKGHRDLNLQFYKDSGLLAKVERRAADPTSGKEFNEERIVLGYHDVDGAKFYKKIQIKRDGEVYLDVENVDAKFPETIDENEFAKP